MYVEQSHKGALKDSTSPGRGRSVGGSDKKGLPKNKFVAPKIKKERKERVTLIIQSCQSLFQSATLRRQSHSQSWLLSGRPVEPSSRGNHSALPLLSPLTVAHFSPRPRLVRQLQEKLFALSSVHCLAQQRLVLLSMKLLLCQRLMLKPLPLAKIWSTSRRFLSSAVEVLLSVRLENSITPVCIRTTLLVFPSS